MGRSGGHRARPRLALLALVSIAVPLVGLVGVVAAELVPDGRIAYALLRSIDSGDLTADNYLDTAMGNQIDKFGDCLVLGAGLGDRPGESIVERALRSPTLGSCETAVPRLETFRDGEPLIREYDYFRYWHGEAVLTRPAIALLGVETTRNLVAIGLLGSAGLLALVVGRRFGPPVALALLVPLVIGTDWWDLPESILHALAMSCVLLTAAVVLRSADSKRSSASSVAMTTALCGAVFVYIDLLTIPPAAWLMATAAAGFAAHRNGGSNSDVLRLQGAGALGWVFGFGWMWVTKWILASVFIGYDRVREDVTGQMNLRLTGDQPEVASGLGAASLRNLDVWFDRPLALVVTLGVFALACLGFARTGVGARGRRALLMVPALLPFLWWQLLSNHSQVHAWFTYRSVALALGVVGAASLVTVRSVPAAEA